MHNLVLATPMWIQTTAIMLMRLKLVQHTDRVILIITENGRFTDSGSKGKSKLKVVMFNVCSDSSISFRALFNPTFATKLDLNMPPAYGLRSPTLSIVSGQSSHLPALISQPPPNPGSGPKMLTFKDMDDFTSAPLVFTNIFIPVSIFNADYILVHPHSPPPPHTHIIHIYNTM